MATANASTKKPLNIQCERGYSFGPVSLHKKQVMLSGKPDYCVWYGEDETLCVNVLVIEAKGGAYATNPIPQLLEYIGWGRKEEDYRGSSSKQLELQRRDHDMTPNGCIHQERKNDKKRSCGVYGMTSTRSV